jgi:outer membrane protein assembly factor BamD (BamD/ComL family)
MKPQPTVTTKTPKSVKKAVSRDPDEVEGSLIKNSFAIAEYFLLKYQNYDSSLARYSSFVNNFSDSILTPKALYSIYFLYNTIYEDNIKADSIKALILDQYKDTPYGEKLSGKTSGPNDEDAGNSIDLNKIKYLEAENYLDKKDYQSAIEIFQQISEQDSGSIWAKKSRYAIAYTYEKFITDTILAIQSYQILANEYPKTDYGKVANNKIANPAKDQAESEKKSPTEITETNVLDENVTSTEEQVSDYIPIDPGSIIDTDMLDSKRPAKTFNQGFEVSEQEKKDKPDNKKKIMRAEPDRLIKEHENSIMPQVEMDSTKIVE